MADSRAAALSRRLSWLLAFRVAVASMLLLLTLAADLSDWPLRRVSEVLYGAGVGTFAAVVALGIALRRRVALTVVGSLHLAAALLVALVVVEVTGVVVSPFAFLYMLAILDGALVGGRRAALLVASISIILYGIQLTLQLYAIWPEASGWSTEPADYVGAFVVHLFAFFLTAWLVGQLGVLLRRADDAASTARTTLREVETVHGAVLASLPIGVLTIERRGHVRLLNLAAAQILGVDERWDAPVELRERLREVLRGGQSEVETVLEVAGCLRTLALRRAPLRAPGELATLFDADTELLLIEDRTEQRALEGALRERERLASLGELAAGIAHEIRNPLAAISGSFELLLDGKTEQRARGTLESVVRREIARLTKLVDDFLLYARPGRTTPTAVDVAALGRELAAVMQNDVEIGERRIRVEAPVSLVARVDAAQTRQMLWNLGRNAIEASPIPGEVVMRFADAVWRGAPAVRFEVEDHGSGIAVEIRPHLFEPFRTTKASGTGLGLAVVRRVVDAHRGDISLEDVPGGGTRAVIFLPRGDVDVTT